MLLRHLESRLRTEGSRPGPPRRTGVIDGPALDAQIAADSTCAACGHHGLTFQSWCDPTGRYQHAVAACPGCHEAILF